MPYKVVSPTRALRKFPQRTFVLVQDNWNDYGFQTQYHLHLSSPEDTTYLGPVKILKAGQTAADLLQVSKDFDKLDEKFVSVGGSLDYYEKLSTLGIDERNRILSDLNDVAKHPALEAKFSAEEGWEKSLFRDQSRSDIHNFLSLARSLASSDYTSLPAEDLKLSFHMTGFSQPLEFDFSPPPPPDSDYWDSPTQHLPSRLIALIGPNGSGKSTLLARLARVAYGTAAHRSLGLFKDLGNLAPIGIGFPRIITVSYSAFDSFTLPGIAPQSEGEPDQRRQIVEDTRRGTGRFIFCGLRDIASELEGKLNEDANAAIAPDIDGDQTHTTLLKPIETLAQEFDQTIAAIKKNDKLSALERALNSVVTDSSFSPWDDGEALASLLLLNAREAFLSWSTGQKIVMQIIANLAAHITPRSLVLIDEPETHLHPPLIAALMHAVRYLLKRYKACAIVATHSPVVLQESLASHVFIVRRDGELITASQPAVETFGENVGYITSEVFRLNSEVTDFHSTLDKLMEKYRDIDTIEKLFVPHGLSLQARAYVMSRLAKKGHG